MKPTLDPATLYQLALDELQESLNNLRSLLSPTADLRPGDPVQTWRHVADLKSMAGELENALRFDPVHGIGAKGRAHCLLEEGIKDQRDQRGLPPLPGI